MLSNEQLLAAIGAIRISSIEIDLDTLKAISDYKRENSTIFLEITLGFPLGEAEREKLQLSLQQTIKNLDSALQLNVTIVCKIKNHGVQQGLHGLKNVKNIIAVASGKGGVGKSTTAVNLALALRQAGAAVGILDADIYGPNQPQMLGINEHPEQNDQKKLKPLLAHGLQAMSIGFLLPQEDTPMIWRGPMVSTALQQLLYDTQWEDLDYLIIDLPPGTGDIQLTLAQKIPVSAAVIVTTPQDIALLDAKKAIRMFEKVNIPVLGIIENMSGYHCANCGHLDNIFGKDGSLKMAEQYQIPMLGVLPLVKSIREQADSGKPTVVADPNSAESMQYCEIALKMTAKLSLLSQDLTRKFPKIVIEKN